MSAPVPSDSGTVELALSCLWLLIVAWLLYRASSQRALLKRIAPAAAPDAALAQTVAVVVPARDEETNIALCLRGLVRQDYPGERLAIVVADDHSADRTAAIAASVLQGRDNAAIVRTPPLPPHWIGKSHACWIGARAVAGDTAWLCFVDADVRFAPGLMARALAAAKAERLDLLSLAPRQELDSFAERLVMPCGLYLLGFYQDLRQRQSPYSRDATATGQFMLIRRSLYEAAGGHAAISGDICEDVALARLIKRRGGRVLLYDGADVISTRMYSGWRTLWPGVAKNLVDMLGGPVSTVTIAVAPIVLSWAAVAIPAAAAASCAQGVSNACFALAPALAGSAAAFALHIVGAAFFRIPFWYGLLFPFGYTAGALMALDSVTRRRQGRVIWKGRTFS